MFDKKNNKIVILEKIGEKNYIKLGETKFKENEDLVNWKNHNIPKPPKNPYAFSSGKTNYIFFDITNKEYITFKKTELGLSTEFLEELFNRKIVSQLVKAVKKATQSEKTDFSVIKQIIVYAGCVLVGYLIGVSYGA